MYAALRRPTLTEALADGEWHRVEYTYGVGGFRSVLVDEREVRWCVEEQPPNGIAREARAIDDLTLYPLPRGADLGADWRMETTRDGRIAVRCRYPGGYWVQSLTHEVPTGKVLEVW